MAEARIDPTEHIPDTNLQEQHAPIDPGLIHEQHADSDQHDWPIDSANEADLAEHSVTVPRGDEEYPHIAGSGRAQMPDALAAVTERLYREHPDVSLTKLIQLIRRCRNDIDIGAPEDCIPELVERVARVRLSERQQRTGG